MSEELEVLKETAGRLADAKISYMISGSMAANLYTVPRMTRDIDIVAEIRQTDIKRFVKTFEKDFAVDEEMMRNEVARNGMFNLIHKKYILKIDFIMRKPTAFQAKSFERRREIIVDGHPLWFISPEDLILAKLLWAQDSRSEMQLNDVRNILRSGGKLDKTYIAEWISSLGLGDIAGKAGL